LMHAGLLGDAVDAAEASVRQADLTSPDDAHVKLRGRARRTLGRIMMEIGNLPTARAMLWEAQRTLVKWPADQAWTFLQLGELLQDVKDYETAATLLERALEFASEAGEVQVMTAAHLNLAYVRRELGDLGSAELQMSQLDEDTRARATALFVEG